MRPGAKPAVGDRGSRCSCLPSDANPPPWVSRQGKRCLSSHGRSDLTPHLCGASTTPVRPEAARNDVPEGALDVKRARACFLSFFSWSFGLTVELGAR